MASRESSGSNEMWRSIVPFLTEMVPVLFERWFDTRNQPTYRELEEDVDRLRSKYEKAMNQVRWLYVFFFFLLSWNVFMTGALIFSIFFMGR